MRPTRLIPRLLPLLAALPLAGALLSAHAGDTPLPTDPRKRLEALQNALVRAAMDGQTRVHTAAWVDSNGKLHENVRINSDMKVRGVRVLNYLQVEDGPSAAIIAEGKGVMPSEEVCKANLQRYRREATFDVQLRIAASGADRYDWTRLLQQAKSKLFAQATAGRKWSLTPRTEMPANAYDRHLLGAKPDIAPYHMQLELLPAGALGIEPIRPRTDKPVMQKVAAAARDLFNDEAPRKAPVPFVMRLSVTERSSGRMLWQDTVPLFFPAAELSISSQPLPPGLLSELDRVLERWNDKMDTDFGCRPQHFNVMPESVVNGWVINGGLVAGLAIGDQLLLMNREHLPARILEPDSAQHLALVEVVSVEAGKAVIRKLAGPRDIARSGDWVATPF